MVSSAEDVLIESKPHDEATLRADLDAALDRSGERLLHDPIAAVATDDVKTDATASSVDGLDTVHITRTVEEGFGFNIVGGTDSQHIPGENGIFVSMVKRGGPAERSGKIKEGDKIVSVNSIPLTDLTHDEVVSVFRSITQSATLLIDRDAELKIISEPASLYHPSYDIMSSTSSYGGLGGLKPVVPSTPVFDRRTDANAYPETAENEDAESTTSYAPSTHSIVDDVPRTPKKPLSLLDPRNPSPFTEVLYVSIGLAVITAGCYVGYRFFKNR